MTYLGGSRPGERGYRAVAIFLFCPHRRYIRRHCPINHLVMVSQMNDIRLIVSHAPIPLRPSRTPSASLPLPSNHSKWPKRWQGGRSELSLPYAVARSETWHVPSSHRTSCRSAFLRCDSRSTRHLIIANSILFHRLCK